MKATNNYKTSPALGLSEDEVRDYSLARAIRHIAKGKPIASLDGIEAEASIAEAERCGHAPDARGFYVPAEIFTREARANSVGVASDGGYLVGVGTSDLISPILSNRARVIELGARVIDGIVGDLQIPRILTGATAYWVTETGSISSSSPTFGQVSVKPRRLGAQIPISNQLLAQTNRTADILLGGHLNRQFGVELDRVAINGAGAAEPLGIMNLAAADRSTSVTFGAATTWAKAVAFENNVENSNAVIEAGAYLTTPDSKTKWKTTLRTSGAGTFIWEGDFVNGYRARSSKNVPGDKVIFGDFSEVFIFGWAGTQITVDPYSLVRDGKVILTMDRLVDVVVREAKAFSISTDSGAQ